MRHRSKAAVAGLADQTTSGSSSRRDRELAGRLRERVKELTLLHKAAQLLQEDRYPDKVLLAELAALLPPAWQFPRICAARIAYAGTEVRTRDWRSTRWKMSQAFATQDGSRGVVEVAYVKRPPAIPFLDEEHALIVSITRMLSSYFERRIAEEKVRRLAYFEPVTGLPNRVSLDERLEAAVRAAGAAGHPLALLLLNLSDFRAINNTLGHRNGDVLLRQVANGLRQVLHQNDLVASLGGDEFVILLARLADHGDIELVVAKIEEAMQKPARIAGIPIKVESAIGVALYPEHGDTAELLRQRSDVALRAAKESHRGHLLYSRAIDHYEPQRISLLGELTSAIKTDQLTLHYQPKVDLRTGRSIGLEVLVRWQHPDHGLLYPDKFIPLAERTQLINPLTRWVLINALEQCRVWRKRHGLRLGISVNLSARSLVDSALCASIPRIAKNAGFALEDLTLEVTESAILADPDRAKRNLDVLHAEGIVVSMDDFGVGQSSLTYLKDLPIRKMKVDKSFIIELADPRNAAIVRGIVELGHNLGMRITAEGIETEATYRELREYGCDVGQGYLFSKPLPPDKLLAWLGTSRWGYAG